MSNCVEPNSIELDTYVSCQFLSATVVAITGATMCLFWGVHHGHFHDHVFGVLGSVFGALHRAWCHCTHRASQESVWVFWIGWTHQGVHKVTERRMVHDDGLPIHRLYEWSELLDTIQQVRHRTVVGRLGLPHSVDHLQTVELVHLAPVCTWKKSAIP